MPGPRASRWVRRPVCREPAKLKRENALVAGKAIEDEWRDSLLDKGKRQATPRSTCATNNGGMAESSVALDGGGATRTGKTGQFIRSSKVVGLTPDGGLRKEKKCADCDDDWGVARKKRAEVMAMSMESIPFDHADDGLHLSFDALADAAAAVLPSRR
ncbi:hypothetical protein CCHR01_11098 [Colletotrichum chrysophilum]|uniref:Uncharacterized protein n=1 Tax=Colletotrichum chrysophilum TaxID=1836956 RepID=A0AAD9AIT9_9PEZI|nr:hypothetical protein CCHR01_11098 [Colletotrichum chrysophilum]